MSPDLAIEILELVVDLFTEPAGAADTLLEIVGKANEAYYAQTGKPIDPFLIGPEQAV
jgi:hypothetical protein